MELSLSRKMYLRGQRKEGERVCVEKQCGLAKLFEIREEREGEVTLQWLWGVSDSDSRNDGNALVLCVIRILIGGLFEMLWANISLFCGALVFLGFCLFFFLILNEKLLSF